MHNVTNLWIRMFFWHDECTDSASTPIKTMWQRWKNVTFSRATSSKLRIGRTGVVSILSTILYPSRRNWMTRFQRCRWSSFFLLYMLLSSTLASRSLKKVAHTHRLKRWISRLQEYWSRYGICALSYFHSFALFCSRPCVCISTPVEILYGFRKENLEIWGSCWCKKLTTLHCMLIYFAMFKTYEKNVSKMSGPLSTLGSQ